MKLKDVEIGGRYLAKVSGKLTTVRVVEIRAASSYGSTRTIIEAVNEATGRRITLRSPQRLRKAVARGCEFCQQSFNRRAGQFTCPYCRTTWSGAED
jgi:hypothetical protein